MCARAVRHYYTRPTPTPEEEEEAERTGRRPADFVVRSRPPSFLPSSPLAGRLLGARYRSPERTYVRVCTTCLIPSFLLVIGDLASHQRPARAIALNTST